MQLQRQVVNPDGQVVLESDDGWAGVQLTPIDRRPGVVFDNVTPARIHIHTVVRTPNGNDYGKDLLRQHYARAHANRH